MGAGAAQVLAIAAPNFSTISETFIHDHVRELSPGATCLLCQDPVRAERFGFPVFSPLDSWISPSGFTGRVARALRWRLRSRMGGGLSRRDRTRAAGFLKEQGVAAVLAEYGTTGVLVASAAGRAGVPLYVHFHGADASAYLRWPHIVRVYRRMFGAAAGIIVPSRFLADRLESIGCPGSKLHIGPCGVDPDVFHPGQRTADRLLAVGRFVEKKAPHLTLKAFAQIASRFPDAELDMIGDGPLVETCRKLVGELGLDRRVRLHGAQERDVVIRHMQQAGIFVQHSMTAANGDCEGIPVAILEAMASALPVVSTRHAGIPEVVRHGETGFLVEERDVDGMAAAISELLGDRQRAREMGDAGRASVLAGLTAAHGHARLRATLGLGSSVAGPSP